MMGTALVDLWHGFGVALQPVNLLWCFVGVLFGNVVGVLPGMGVMAAIIARCVTGWRPRTMPMGNPVKA